MKRPRVSTATFAATIACLFYFNSLSLLIPTQHSQQKMITLPSTPPNPINQQRQCEHDAREHIRKVGGDPLAHIATLQ